MTKSLPRFVFLASLALATALVPIAQLAYLQLTNAGLPAGQEGGVTTHKKALSARRGFIFDRHQNVLAVSTPVFPIEAAVGLVNPKEAGFVRLAELLGRNQVQLQAELIRQKRQQFTPLEFVSLKQQATSDLADSVLALGLAGISSRTDYQRYYPAGAVAASVVGLTNKDESGQTGVEFAFERRLQGEPGQKQVLADRHGRNIKDLEYLKPSRIGQNLSLSLDLRLQHIAYRELGRTLQQQGAKAGSIILLDVDSGEVLTMVSRPAYNPNTQADKITRVRTGARFDVFNPGATLTPLLITAALNSGHYHRYSILDTHPGVVQIKDKVFKDKINYGLVDLPTLISQSSQVGTIRLLQSLDASQVFTMMERFGFGQPTGLEMFEVAGALPDFSALDKLGLAAVAHGYGMTVTSAQLARAYLVFANQGVLKQLSILDQKVHPRSEQQAEPVITKATASSVLEMLSISVERRIPATLGSRLYQIAGKGAVIYRTARNSHDIRPHAVVFAGIVPATQPRLVGVVVVHKPERQARDNDQIAATVFARVTDSALRLLAVRPDHPDKVVL